MNLQTVKYFSGLMLRSAVNGNLNFYKAFALLHNLTLAYRKIPKVAHGPSAMWAEPVNFCNLKCEGCWVPEKQTQIKNKAMVMDTFKTNIDSVSDSLIFLVLQMSGEPFLHKGVFEMIRYATDKKIAVWTSTNGSFKTSYDWGEKIVESGLDTLYISVSGMSQESYELYHQGGELNEIITNINKIQAAKKKAKSKTPYMYFRMLECSYNEDETPKVKKLAKELGIGVHVRRINTSYVYQGIPPKEPDHTSVNITATYEPEVENHCYNLWIAPAFTSRNKVLPCCYDWLYPPEMGETNDEQTVRDVWFSQKYNNFRKVITTKRKTYDACTYCDNSVGFKDNFSQRENKITISFKEQKTKRPNHPIFPEKKIKTQKYNEKVPQENMGIGQSLE